MGGGDHHPRDLEAEAKNTEFIPVLFSSRSSADIPIVLRGLNVSSFSRQRLRPPLSPCHSPTSYSEAGSRMRRPMPPGERTLSMSVEVSAVTSPLPPEQPWSERRMRRQRKAPNRGIPT